MDILKEVNLISDEIFSIRKQIHMYPELGNHEYRTAGIIEDYLRAAGIRVVKVTETGIAGMLECCGKGGCAGGFRTVAVRADMDALPVEEETGSEFSSRNSGVMHACGHDVHTAALLGAARVLADHRDELQGKIIFIFQPDEEGDGGAARMTDAGLLDEADAVFGAHVSPELPAGTAGFRYGNFYAAADMFDVTVTGHSSHAAERDKGIDALAAASEMVIRLLQIPAVMTGTEGAEADQIHDRSNNPGCVLSAGTFRAGTARNILAGRAEFSGIIRTLGPELRGMVRDTFMETIRKVDAERGTDTSVRYISGYPGVTNDDNMTALAERAAAALLGSENVVRIERPTMMTEDFGYYQHKVPGCFYHIGAGCGSPLHSPEFLPSDDAVLTAAAVHTAVVSRFLRGE